MSVLIQRHLDSLAAQMALLNAQLDALRHAVAIEETRQAQPATRTDTEFPKPTLPERCAGIAERCCAIQDDDARKMRSSFGNPNAWRCVGCGYDGDTSVAEGLE